MAALFVTLIPLTYIYIRLKQGKLTDIHIVIRGQRIIPLLFAIISALIGLLMLYFLEAPEGLIHLGICYIVNSIVFILITQFWKISLHCGVISGCITALAYIVTPKMLFLLFLVPIVAWARIQKKHHTFTQTLAGAIISVIITGLTLQIIT
jgi:membrane-associated phospholipid phosphatase